MSKREVFIVADGGQWPDTEAGLLGRLDADEAFLLKQHPKIDNEVWRSFINFDPDAKQEQVAVITIDRLRALRVALQNPDTPAWLAAVLAMKFQDMVMIYRQPITASAKGRVHRKGAAGRSANDELVMRVLRNLRDMSTAEALEAMRVREKINGVYVNSTGPVKKQRWFFESRDRQGNILSSVDYAESTLISKKFPKAKQRVTES